jgi:hypothetical protein
MKHDVSRMPGFLLALLVVPQLLVTLVTGEKGMQGVAVPLNFAVLPAALV